MEKDENCIFCKIVAGEIPAHKVYEDDKSFAFLDIHPVEKGHVLLIPKEHIVWMHETNDELLGEMFVKAKRLMQAMIRGLESDLVEVVVFGEEVPHFHIKLIPIKRADGFPHAPTKTYESGEEEIFADKIKTNIL